MPCFWTNQVGDCNNKPLTILETPKGNFSVIEHKRAIYHSRNKKKAEDWYIVGDYSGGIGYDVLWLYGTNKKGNFTPMEAWTKFDQPSSMIAFVMGGDYNDGFVEFLVDEKQVLIHDLYNLGDLGDQILIVEGLEYTAHTLRVKLAGKKNLNSKGYDAHIYGGLALT